MFLAFERLADTSLLVAVAVAAFVLPAVFLALVAYAASRRIGSREVGGRLAAAVCVAGGASLGVLVLFAPDAAIAAPLVLALGALVIASYRSGKRRQAGALLLGAGLAIGIPWVLAVLGRGLTDEIDRISLERVAWLAVGLGVSLAGVLLMVRGDRDAAPPSPAAAAGQPGSRHLGSLAQAIREPGMVGPFALPELAMLVAFVAMWLAVPFWLPPDAHLVVQLAVPGIVAALVGTEAYIRSMPPRSRRAFEAFSWLGEWELARARELTGRGVPTTRGEARTWLAERPERLDRLAEAALRVEVLLLAEQIGEARYLVERMAERATTPWERFEVASLDDLVEWRAGGDGDLDAMVAAAADILPRDGDDRLRAEVTIAVAGVRRLMADPARRPGEAVNPLLDVRELLGSRADGQVGRALRMRLLPALLVASVLFAVVGGVLGGFGSPA